MFGDCCMVQLLYVQLYGYGVAAWALWFDGFCGGYGGFDTPRNASVSNGFKLSGLSGLTFPIGNTYDGANKTNEH